MRPSLFVGLVAALLVTAAGLSTATQAAGAAGGSPVIPLEKVSLDDPSGLCCRTT